MPLLHVPSKWRLCLHRPGAEAFPLWPGDVTDVAVAFVVADPIRYTSCARYARRDRVRPIQAAGRAEYGESHGAASGDASSAMAEPQKE